MQLLVSIIITTKNEEHAIAACLSSIKKQSYSCIESIVIDNNSSDKTKETAHMYGARVYTKGPERSAQRNFGAQKAKGKYLLFLDADMELTPHVVEKCMELIGQYRKQPKLVALVIPEESFGVGFWAQCKALERSYYLNVPWIESARFFEKKIFQKAGGYDETLTGPEDFEFSQRVKRLFGDNATGRINFCIRHNEGKFSLKETLQKKYYYGKTIQKYRHSPAAEKYFDKQSSIWRRYALFFTKPSILIRHPVLFIGMIIMKTLEMGAIAKGALGL